MIRRLIVLSLIVVGAGFTLTGCRKPNDVRHSDYGYCERTAKHKHNDHIFIGDYHDHTLCEWAKFE